VPVTDDEHSLAGVLPPNHIRYLIGMPSTSVWDDLRGDPEVDGQWPRCSFGADELSDDDRLNTGFPNRNNKGLCAQPAGLGQLGVGSQQRLSFCVAHENHRRWLARARGTPADYEQACREP